MKIGSTKGLSCLNQVKRESLLEDLDVSDLSGVGASELTFLVKEVLNEGLISGVGDISLAP